MKKDHRGPTHHLPPDEVSRLLDVDLRTGLTDDEARRRLAEYGPNRLTPRKRMSELKRFLLQFHQPLIYILLVAAAVTLGLGEFLDASVILGVVIINAIIGYLQESKAEASIEALAASVTTLATVRRGGKKQQVASVDLVPGDVVLLQSGDKVPADLRLVHVRNLQVDEATLTGESVPAPKHADILHLDTVLADRRNQAFAGTLVTYGQAEGVVWATGDQTETGRVARLLHEAVELSTPLTRKIEQFSRLLMVLIIIVAAVAFVIGLLRGYEVVEMFMASVALAVGAIPEGLPAAVTITLAIGVNRMARRKVVIRRLPAVETLGSTTIICSDKTGTLTQNQMTVTRIWTAGGVCDVTGSGYAAEGCLERNGAAAPLERDEALRECLRAGLLCNDAQITRSGGDISIQGDPTEVALIVAAEKAGLLAAAHAAEQPRIDVIPFESQHQYMATLHPHHIDGRVIYKKGAVERLVERCTTMLMPDGRLAPIDPAAIHEATAAMAAAGMRVLGFARRLVPNAHATVEHDHVARELTFLGLQGMIDPPRPEAIAAVKRCQNAGIRVKMITGDHLLTARAVAQQLGILADGAPEDAAASGRTLEQISDADLPAFAEHASVFARVSPEQKLRLVRALQARGHVAAMTGDGVNDAPALKQADIGVAMGVTGTDVAKSAADMIIVDDNFASIEAAVEEGRSVFDNLSKFIVWTLPTNAAEAAVLLVAIVAGSTVPALPVHLLWINMTTAIFLGLTLVFEPAERDIMLRPPRDPRAPILTFPLFMRTGLVTLITTIGAYGLFVWEQQSRGIGVAEARTIVVNVIVMVEIFYLLNCRSLTHSLWQVGLLANKAVPLGIAGMIAVQVLFTYAPFMNRLFHTAPLDATSWMHIVIVGATAGLIVGFEKWVRFNLAARIHRRAV